MGKWTGPKPWQELRFSILKRDRFKCWYCGARGYGVRLQVDHVLPKRRGGTDDPANLVTACKDCNEGKAASLMDAEQQQRIRQGIKVVMKKETNRRRWELYRALKKQKAERMQAIADEIEQQLKHLRDMNGPR